MTTEQIITTSLPAFNYDLAYKVRDAILAEPRRVYMAAWLYDKGHAVTDYIDEKYVSQRTCGTTGCLAGWCAILSANLRGEWKHNGYARTAKLIGGARCTDAQEVDFEVWLEKGAKLSGLTNAEATDLFQFHAKYRIFNTLKFLEPFQEALQNQVPLTKGYAAVVAGALEATIGWMRATGRRAKRPSSGKR